MGMGLLWQTDYLNNERESCMKKKNKKRAATIAALSCIAIILGILALSDNHDTKIQSTKVVPTVTPAPAATDTISQTPALTPQSSPSWTPPEKTTSPIERPTEIEDGDFFTLTIEGKIYVVSNLHFIVDIGQKIALLFQRTNGAFYHKCMVRRINIVRFFSEKRI